MFPEGIQDHTQKLAGQSELKQQNMIRNALRWVMLPVLQ